MGNCCGTYNVATTVSLSILRLFSFINCYFKGPNQKKEHLPTVYNRTVPNGQKPYKISARMVVVVVVPSGERKKETIRIVAL
jgi:hypothetical protein